MWSLVIVLSVWLIRGSCEASQGHRPGLRVMINEKLVVGKTVTVPVKHINKRGNPMRGLRVFNEKYGEHLAIVEAVRGDIASLRIQECLRPPHDDDELSEDVHRLKLMFVPQKNTPRFRNCLDSCTQLGVSEFVLISSEKAGTGSNAISIDYEAVKTWIVASLEQSERIKVPPINRGSEIRDAIDTIRDGAAYTDGRRKSFFVAVEPRYTRGRDEGEARTMFLLEALAARGSGLEKRDDYLVVGPEGGWTPEELEEMLQLSESAEVDIIPVTLGAGIMRSETAATVGVGIWAHVNSH